MNSQSRLLRMGVILLVGNSSLVTSFTILLQRQQQQPLANNNRKTLQSPLTNNNNNNACYHTHSSASILSAASEADMMMMSATDSYLESLNSIVETTFTAASSAVEAAVMEESTNTNAMVESAIEMSSSGESGMSAILMDNNVDAQTVVGSTGDSTSGLQYVTSSSDYNLPPIIEDESSVSVSAEEFLNQISSQIEESSAIISNAVNNNNVDAAQTVIISTGDSTDLDDMSSGLQFVTSSDYKLPPPIGDESVSVVSTEELLNQLSSQIEESSAVISDAVNNDLVSSNMDAMVDAINRNDLDVSEMLSNLPDDAAAAAAAAVVTTASSTSSATTTTTTTTLSDESFFQLSNNLSYDTILDEPTTSTIDETTKSTLSNQLHRMAAGTSSQIHKLFSQASVSISNSASSRSQVIASGTDNLKHSIVNSMELDTTASSITNTAHIPITDASVTDLANDILNALQILGTISYQILDEILKDVGDSSVSNVIKMAQTSIDTLIGGATLSVSNTMDHIGDTTLKDVVGILVTTVLTVTRITFSILNGVVRLASGKDATEWITVAERSMEEEATLLTAQAASTASDISHKSLSELGSMVGDFSSKVTEHVVSLVVSDHAGVVVGSSTSAAAAAAAAAASSTIAQIL